MNKNIQILNFHTGSVIFEYEQENNTVKDTVIEAVKKHADLRVAHLSYVDLSGVDLCGANLSGVDLRGANLRGANLRGANLSDADLRVAELSGADLRVADLSGADLRGANLRGADLHFANFSDADLSDADLRGASLSDANLSYAKNVPYIPLSCPSEGAFIGWKKVHSRLVKLEIPEDASRSSATTNKCRCDKAKVLSITDLDGENPIEEIENTSRSHHVTYKVGEMVYPDSFDEDRWNECSHGIHFFINKQDAINY